MNVLRKGGECMRRVTPWINFSRFMELFCDCMRDGHAYGYTRLFCFLLFSWGWPFQVGHQRMIFFKFWVDPLWMVVFNQNQAEINFSNYTSVAIFKLTSLMWLTWLKTHLRILKQESSLHPHITNLYIQISRRPILHWFNHITLQTLNECPPSIGL